MYTPRPVKSNAKNARISNAKNSGAVLIYVLGIAVILGGLLATMQSKNMLATKRIGALMREAEARYMAYSAQSLTKTLLEKDLHNNATDGIGDNWYRFQSIRSFPIEGGTIALKITDANAVHNINQTFTSTSRDPHFMPIFKRYLDDINIPTSLADSAKDWIDNDNQITGSGGAEKFDYNYSRPPYAPANAPMVAMGDLRLLKGYEPKMWDILEKNVNILPTYADINVNTASKALLISLFPQNSKGITQAIGARKTEPFATVGDFYQEAGIANTSPAVRLSTITTYFNLEAEVEYNGTRKKLKALYERDNGRAILRRIQCQ